MFERDDRWIFYAVVIVAPLGLIAILLPVPLSVRYFMISVAASLVLLSSGYAALLRRGVAGLGIGLTLLAIFVAGNAVNTGNLLRFGRGQYLAALRFMEKNSDGREVVITSDHHFRNAMLVNYYKRYLERPDYIRYMDGPALHEEYVRTNGTSLGAEWLILHRFDLREQPERVTDHFGNNYQLMTIYRFPPFRLELATRPQPQLVTGETAQPVVAVGLNGKWLLSNRTRSKVIDSMSATAVGTRDNHPTPVTAVWLCLFIVIHNSDCPSSRQSRGGAAYS